MADGDPEMRIRLTRREMLAGAALLGIGAGLETVVESASTGSTATAGSSSEALAPYGPRQMGIATPAQAYLHFAAFDVISEAADDLRSVLEQWTVAATRLTAGEPYQSAAQELDEPPMDTGEAIGLGPARLTVTIGLGPSAFGSPGEDRFGLARRRPAELQPLPAFQGDSLEPSSSWRAPVWANMGERGAGEPKNTVEPEAVRGQKPAPTQAISLSGRLDANQRPLAPKALQR